MLRQERISGDGFRQWRGAHHNESDERAHQMTFTVAPGFTRLYHHLTGAPVGRMPQRAAARGTFLMVLAACGEERSRVLLSTKIVAVDVMVKPLEEQCGSCAVADSEMLARLLGTSVTAP